MMLRPHIGDVAWNPPGGWTRITTIDAHTEGEPLRVIVDGFPTLEGDTILERRRNAQARFDPRLIWDRIEEGT